MLIYQKIFSGVLRPRGIIKIRRRGNIDLKSDKKDFFFLLPLDAVVDGPILVGIQGYGPGKKAWRQQLKRQKKPALSVHKLI
ncbi:hypothetical protein AAH450_12515 [Erwinia sp. P7711]|uniref:hypothetical protein n=1 Tax=Erwinia sp. P7711 TaxID=3141451 RepID=UPI0031897CB5